MIKLQKQPNPPQVLQSNSESWTADLLAAVIQYGGYSEIPRDQRDRLVNRYNKAEIKQALLESSYNKCAFCECIPSESSYIEIEHFHPKSVYPGETFDWDNLLPSCKRCNINKDNLDTINEPILNPYIDDPQEAFIYDCLLMIPESSYADKIKAKRTIDELGLNEVRLLEPRSKLYLAFSTTLMEIQGKLDDLNNETQERRKKKIARALLDSIETIEGLAKSENKYAGFISFLLSNQEIYINARKLVESILQPSSVA